MLVKAEELPEVLRVIAETAGYEAAMTLALEYGGRPFIFPRDAPKGRGTAGSLLASFVGPEAARKLAAMFDGERVDIPKVNRALILWLRSKGMNNVAIAARLRVNLRTVYDHLPRKGNR